jgi:hypothetical protein
MSRRAVWREVYDRFDPERPAGVAAWRADRAQSPAEAIAESLDMPFGDPRVLLMGTVGTGKTTELLRLAEARAGKELVIFLDLERHFADVLGDAPALQHVQSWEVCFLAAMALIRVASERLGYELPEAHLRDLGRAWATLAKTTGATVAAPQIDLPTAARAMVVLTSAITPLVATPPVATGLAVGLKTLEAAAGAVKWALPVGVGKRALPDQDSDMQTLLACVNVLVGLVQKQSSRVLLILDGLDRIRDLDRAKALFVESQMIAQLACPIVVCGPFALRHDPAITAVRRFTEIRVLVNEPVLLEANPVQHGPGVRFFCELFDRRTADLAAPALLPRPLLEQLAYRSGGRARDFVRFIRELAKVAWQADAPAATEAQVARVLDEQRRLRETGLHKGHIRLLEAIAEDPRHELPEGELAQELLSYGSLLPYPNESEWYYPHTLLTMNLVRPTSGRQAAPSA